MTSPRIQMFLTELYAIDPDLQLHEEQLIPLIEQLLQSDPAVSPDQQFISSLRTQLRERAATLSSHPISSPITTMQKLLYTFGGALTAAIIVPIVYLGITGPMSQTSSPLFGYKIEAAGSNAFGSLNDVQANAAGGQGGGGDTRTQSGGGGGNAAIQLPAEDGTGDETTVDQMPSKLIAPGEWYQYDYVFEGELPELLGEKVSVFKRDTKNLRLALSSILDRFNVGSLDLGSFGNANVESLNFVQNTPFGYYIYVGLREGSIGINANWEQWPQSKCQTEACFQSERIKIGDVPSDESMIEIANAFVREHGIDLSAYGSPEIDNNWRRQYDRATDKSMIYIPDVQRVVYPLMIDGQPVHDQSGMKVGLSISVHMKHKKVFDVWGLMDRTYLKSDYAGVTDEQKIRDFVAKYNQYPMPIDPLSTEQGGQPQPTHRKVTLGTPTISYATFYRYTENRSEELVVPSLVFPVENVEGEGNEYMYNQSVVVPLAAEMLEAQTPQFQIMDGAMPRG